MKLPEQDIEKVLFSLEQIDVRCKELAKDICDYYQERNPMIIGVLKGCVPFFEHLVENINIYCTLDYISASSYSGTESTGKIKITENKEINVKDREILLVEDIVDTGLTIKEISNYFISKGAKDVKVCSLLDKKSRRTNDVNVDYPAFEVGNYFVVGFGLDFNEQYRNIPYIGVLKEDLYK